MSSTVGRMKFPTEWKVMKKIHGSSHHQPVIVLIPNMLFLKATPENLIHVLSVLWFREFPGSGDVKIAKMAIEIVD